MCLNQLSIFRVPTKYCESIHIVVFFFIFFINSLCYSIVSPICRYKIYAEGYAWSVSLKYILACGSVPLIITPEYQDFFSRGLIPKKNFIPIPPSDLCQSLKLAVDWGNAHPREVFYQCFASCFFLFTTFLVKVSHG